MIAQADQSGQPFARHGAVGLELGTAISDGKSLGVNGLADRAVGANKETPLGDVALPRGRREGGLGRCGYRRCLSHRESGKPINRGRELRGEIAAALDAIAGFASVKRVLAAPVAQHHLGMLVEISVDGNLDAFDVDRPGFQPCRVSVLGFLSGGPFAQEHDIGDDGRAFAFEGVGGKADCAHEVGLFGEAFANGGVLLIERVMTGHNGEDAAGLQRVDAFGNEIIMQGEFMAMIADRDIGERRVADDGVDFRQARFLERFDPDIRLRM